MKILHTTFFVVLGAALASWATHRILESEHGRGVSTSDEKSSTVVLPPTPLLPTGPTMAQLEQANREKDELARELAEARAKLAQSDLTLALVREDLDELRRPMTSDLLSSTLSAELKSGEVVVTGGYRLPDGTRLYAFVQPTIEQVEGADVVRITSSVRTLGDEVGASVGLGNLATNADNTLQHGEVWLADEKRAVFAALDGTGGSPAVSMPDVTVLPGVSSVIEFGDLRLKVTPSPGADADSLDFEVRVEQARPAPPVEEPAEVPMVPIVN
ncbi:MAG: hypothetical protein H7067_05840 [Burkholderiales bacterium]|nr:hypothetical protein [Opitutaceae bacterium]